MEKTMFPREFVIWKDNNTIYYHDFKTPYFISIKNIWTTLDKLYKYWLTEIKTKEDGK